MTDQDRNHAAAAATYEEGDQHSDPVPNNGSPPKKVDKATKGNKSAQNTNNDFLQSIPPQAASILGCALIASCMPVVTWAWAIVALVGVPAIVVFRNPPLTPLLPLHKGKLQTLFLAFVCYHAAYPDHTPSENAVVRHLLSGEAPTLAYWVAVLAFIGSIQLFLGIGALTRCTMARFRPDLLREDA